MKHPGSDGMSNDAYHGAAGHHPPEHYASLVSVPVIAVFLALAWRPRSVSVQ